MNKEAIERTKSRFKPRYHPELVKEWAELDKLQIERREYSKRLSDVRNAHKQFISLNYPKPPYDIKVFP